MAQFGQLSVPQFVHREIVGISTTSRVCLCCLDQNIPFVKLATCKHCSFFEALLKHKVRYREAVVCYQCHSFLKKIELFKNRAEESLRNLKKHVKIMKIPSDLDLSYSVPEITVIPNNRSLDDSYLPTVEAVKNKTEVPTAPPIMIDTMDIKIEYNESHNELSSIPDMDIDMLDELTGISPTLLATSSTVDECEKRTKLPKKDTVVEKDKEESNPYEGKIIRVTISEQQLLEERQERALKEDYLERPFKCETCITGFQNNSSYKDHLKKKHTMIKGCLQCHICKTVINTRYSYQQHMKRHFTRYVCGACGQRHINAQTLLAHYNKQHEVIQVTYNCTDCDFVTNTSQKYYLHREKEHHVKTICPVCSMVMCRKSALKYHMLRHEKNSCKFSCQVCSKTYNTNKGLIDHMRYLHRPTTGTEKNAHCIDCNKQFLNQNTLNTHLKLHSKHRRKDYDFICNDCGGKYPTKSHLREHIEWKHLMKIPHTCDKCSKPFRFKSQLRKHHKIFHENVKLPKD